MRPFCQYPQSSKISIYTVFMTLIVDITAVEQVMTNYRILSINNRKIIEGNKNPMLNTFYEKRKLYFCLVHII